MAVTGENDSEAGYGPVGKNTRRVVLASDDPVLAALIAAVQASSAISSVPSVGVSDDTAITRTNDTNAYNANDVIGAATGSTAAIEFTGMGDSAGRMRITRAELLINASAIISGESDYRLHLYNVTPPSALGDNAAWDLPSGDRASYLGYLDLGLPTDLGSTLYVQTEQNLDIKLAGTSVFGYLVTTGAHTPTAQRVFTVTLHGVKL